jgi:putative Ca2+/H+ antiporter (TMEM165/GDT1 family)
MPIDLRVLASVYGVIFVAELPDKTALASLVLATRYRAWAVFIGASLALTVQSIVAVAAGQLFSLLPQRPVHLVAGLLFLVSAYFMWRRSTDRNDSGEVEDGRGFWRQIRNTFVVLFIAEWGDLTQIGTAALAARYHAPVTVFVGATAALWSVVAIVVFLGNRAARALNPEVTKKVAAAIFVAVGLALAIGVL